MKTARVKNIVILILLLLNVFLLTLLLSLKNQEIGAYERSLAQLSALYEQNEIRFDSSLLRDKEALPALKAVRGTDTEKAFAEALLGEITTEDSGGGIYRYYSVDSPQQNLCTFRSSGALEASLQLQIDDPAAFCTELCEAFGYTEQVVSLDASGGTITATRMLEGFRVYNCTLRFTFVGNTLTAIEGSFLPTPSLSGDSFDTDLITALVRFLDYRNASGLICTQIKDIQNGYLLHTTATSPLLLSPVVRIETDVNNYYVNISSGEILRESTGSAAPVSLLLQG